MQKKIIVLGVPILSLFVSLGLYYLIIICTNLLDIPMGWFFISSGIYLTVFLSVLLLNYYPKKYDIRTRYLRYTLLSYFFYLILAAIIGTPLYMVPLIGKFEYNIHLHILIAAILGFALTKLYFHFTKV